MKRLALLVLLACGPSTPAPTQLAQVLIPNPAKIDFGFVPAGQVVMTELTLHNSGTQSLHLAAPIISQAGMGFSALSFPQFMQPNETSQGQVQFASDATEGHSTGNIELSATEFPDNILIELRADAGM